MSREANPAGETQGEIVETLARQLAHEQRIPIGEARSQIRSELQAARRRSPRQEAAPRSANPRRTARVAMHGVTNVHGVTLGDWLQAANYPPHAPLAHAQAAWRRGDDPAHFSGRQQNPIPVEPPAGEKSLLATMNDAELTAGYRRSQHGLAATDPKTRDAANRRICWYLWEGQRRGLHLERSTPPVRPRAQNPVDMTLPRGFLVKRYGPSGSSLQNEGVEQCGEQESEDDMLLRLAKLATDGQILEIDDGKGYRRRVRVKKDATSVGFVALPFEAMKDRETTTERLGKQVNYGRAQNPTPAGKHSSAHLNVKIYRPDGKVLLDEFGVGGDWDITLHSADMDVLMNNFLRERKTPTSIVELSSGPERKRYRWVRTPGQNYHDLQPLTGPLSDTSKPLGAHVSYGSRARNPKASSMIRLVHMAPNNAYVFLINEAPDRLSDEDMFFATRALAVAAAKRHGLKVTKGGAVESDGGPNPFAGRGRSEAYHQGMMDGEESGREHNPVGTRNSAMGTRVTLDQGRDENGEYAVRHWVDNEIIGVYHTPVFEDAERVAHHLRGLHHGHPHADASSYDGDIHHHPPGFKHGDRLENPVGTKNKAMGTRVTFSAAPEENGQYAVRQWLRGELVGVYYTPDKLNAETVKHHLAGIHHGHPHADADEFLGERQGPVDRLSNPVGSTNSAMGTRVTLVTQPNENGEYAVRHWIKNKIVGVYYTPNPKEAERVSHHLRGIHHGHPHLDAKRFNKEIHSHPAGFERAGNPVGMENSAMGTRVTFSPTREENGQYAVRQWFRGELVGVYRTTDKANAEAVKHHLAGIHHGHPHPDADRYLGERQGPAGPARKGNPTKKARTPTRGFRVQGWDGEASGLAMVSPHPSRIMATFPTRSAALQAATAWANSHPPHSTSAHHGGTTWSPEPHIFVQELFPNHAPITFARWVPNKKGGWDAAIEAEPPKEKRQKKTARDWNTTANDADKDLMRQMMGSVHVATTEDEVIAALTRRFGKNANTPLGRSLIESALDAHYENYRLYVDVMQRRSMPEVRPSKGKGLPGAVPMLPAASGPKSGKAGKRSENPGPTIKSWQY
jgi:hypothetical protein